MKEARKLFGFLEMQNLRLIFLYREPLRVTKKHFSQMPLDAGKEIPEFPDLR